MSEVYHYSPELLQLLVDTIEVLCRSKRDVVLFFRSVGVDGPVINDLAERVSRDPESIKKREIAQQLLVLVNEGGDATLRQRREIVKRVVEWENFSTCWPDQQLQAQGLVAQVRSGRDRRGRTRAGLFCSHRDQRMPVCRALQQGNSQSSRLSGEIMLASFILSSSFIFPCQCENSSAHP